MSAWQPIETAPRDGTLVDLWGEEWGRWTDATWKSDHWSRFSHSRRRVAMYHAADDDNFTHWMLPTEPPEVGS